MTEPIDVTKLTPGEIPDVRSHESGLKTQAVTGPNVSMSQMHRLELPACCPVSANPQPGSYVEISYRSEAWCLEVYALAATIQRFVGGWPGTPSYPADRNMEGMIRLLAQMSADALGVPVTVRAYLMLDAGRMELTVYTKP